MINRRTLLVGSLAASSAFLVWKNREPSVPTGPWEKEAYVKRRSSRVAILEAKGYNGSLTDTIRRGIKLFGLDVRGKTVILKPNLVEYDPNGVINTHPAVIAATIEAFRRLDTKEVIVAESPGHRRDHEYLLTASGVWAALKDTGTRYVDLDYDNVRLVKLRSRFTPLGQLYLPETVLDADLLVSMPKLKTHHWAGVTLSLKNMFGIVPGALYGWPKNLLHQVGIGNSILDINSSLPMSRFAIVDGIIGMEGDGPLKGEAKQTGVLIFGEDHLAVDATATRIMKIAPEKVGYLAQGAQFLGNMEREAIEQIGERLEVYQQDFQVVPSFQHLKT